MEDRNRELQIKRLQDNLATIRMVARWTSEELGHKIGVTKQTISNLENKRTKMNFTQYIAIRTILDEEISKQEDDLLMKIVALLLDSDDSVSEQEYKEIENVTEAIAINSKTVKSNEKLEETLELLLRTFSFMIPLLASIFGTKGNWKKKL